MSIRGGLGLWVLGFRVQDLGFPVLRASSFKGAGFRGLVATYSWGYNPTYNWGTPWKAL